MNHNKQQSSDGGHDDDAALSDFLASLMDYTPTIPDELVEHFLAKTGFQSPDLRLDRDVLPKVNVITESLRDGAVQSALSSAVSKTRLVAVATQKFIAEVASDALQQCKARQATVVRDKRDKQQKDKRLVLTMEDLSRALHEHGVNVKHQEYFADSPSIGMDPASRDE